MLFFKGLLVWMVFKSLDLKLGLFVMVLFLIVLSRFFKWFKFDKSLFFWFLFSLRFLSLFGVLSFVWCNWFWVSGNIDWFEFFWVILYCLFFASFWFAFLFCLGFLFLFLFVLLLCLLSLLLFFFFWFLWFVGNNEFICLWLKRCKCLVCFGCFLERESFKFLELFCWWDGGCGVCDILFLLLGLFFFSLFFVLFFIWFVWFDVLLLFVFVFVFVDILFLLDICLCILFCFLWDFFEIVCWLLDW